MNAFASRAVRSGIVVAACIFAQGCGRSDPLDMTVDADSFVALVMWKDKAADRLGPVQMAEFDEAVREIKFEAMADGAASGTEAVEEVAREMINGRTARDVMEMGLEWEMSRLQAEHWALDTASSSNARARTKPGDTDSANYLQGIVQRQDARAREEDKEIERIRKQLIALDPQWVRTEFVRPFRKAASSQPAAPTPVPPDSPPQRTSRGKMQTQANT
jgi:hypothetical protein